RPAVCLFHKSYLFFTEWLAMCGARILTMRRAISDMTLYDYDGRFARRSSSIPKRSFDSIEIVGIPDANNVPSVGKEPPSDILGKRDIRLAFDRDVIAIVDPAKVVEF